MIKSAFMHCLECDATHCTKDTFCETVLSEARRNKGISLQHRGRDLEQGDTIICNSPGDKALWIEQLERLGYGISVNHYNHIITILRLPEVK